MRRILVIDDDKSVRAAIKTVLELEGFEVLLAEDGRSGIDAIETAAFDLVLVDIFMPGMDGFETIKAFHECRPTVPIIVMSGFMFRDTTVRAPDFLAMATKLGAACSLPKPFRPHQLTAAINACLGDGVMARRDWVATA